MDNISRSTFTRWIFDSYNVSAEGLALYRVFCALFILFYAMPAVGSYAFLSDLPTDFFAPPPGPMMFFRDFPPKFVFLAFHSLLIVVLLFLLVGFATRTVSISSGILLLILKGFIYSTGKIDHDILLAVVPLIMAFSGWGKAYSVDAFRIQKDGVDTQSWTLTLLALVIGFMMFTAGFPKILGGWLDISTQATQGHYFKQFMVRGRQDLLAPYGQYLELFWWEFFDYFTVMFEVGFLLAIVKARSTKFYLCLAVLFHFGTMLILNIAFLPNFLAYAAFLNWDWINQKIKTKLPVKEDWISPACIVGIMVVVAALARYLEKYRVLQSDLEILSVIVVSGSVPVALYFIFSQVFNISTAAKT